MKFLNEFHNFGKIEAGEQISFSFKFQNTGTGVLKIDSVISDCGCIVVSFPEENILPNESNYIDVLFNSRGEMGRVLRQIEIFANNGQNTSLSITADVNNPIFN